MLLRKRKINNTLKLRRMIRVTLAANSSFMYLCHVKPMQVLAIALPWLTLPFLIGDDGFGMVYWTCLTLGVIKLLGLSVTAGFHIAALHFRYKILQRRFGFS